MKLQPNFADARQNLHRITIVPQGLGSPHSDWRPDPMEENHPFVPDDIPFENGWLAMADLDKREGLNVLIMGGEYTVRKLDDERVKLWCGQSNSHNMWLPFIGKIGSLGVSILPDTGSSNLKIDYYPAVVATATPEFRTHLEVPTFAYDDNRRLLSPHEHLGFRVGEVLGMRVFDLRQGS